MSALTRFFFVLAFFSVCTAYGQVVTFKGVGVQPTKITLSDGRVLFTQIVPPASKNGVTLLFMPGINRSTLVEEKAVQLLIQKGYGAVTYNFSTHPLSVALLDKNEEAYFESHELKLEDFADETEKLAQILADDYAMKKIVPVSLSFSGAVSSYLKQFPLIIDTAPMTSNAAVNPQMETFRKNLIISQAWNPLFGPGIVRATLDTLYESNWKPQVEAISAQFGFEPSDAMVKGYSMMSRASEDFKWTNDDVRIQGRRLFLVAQNESEALKQNQIETFKALKLDGSLVIVENSGHIIPFDQPEKYVELIDNVCKSLF